MWENKKKYQKTRQSVNFFLKEWVTITDSRSKNILYLHLISVFKIVLRQLTQILIKSYILLHTYYIRLILHTVQNFVSKIISIWIFFLCVSWIMLVTRKVKKIFHSQNGWMRIRIYNLKTVVILKGIDLYLEMQNFQKFWSAIVVKFSHKYREYSYS